MDLISLTYFRELARDLNMTRTAARLFMSQQTLSNHIRRVEQHFGTPLFHRKPSLSLTDAGLVVLDFAQAVAREEAGLNDVLTEVAHQSRGLLRMGAGAVRGNWFLPHLVPDFHDQFPDVRIEFTDAVSAQLEKMVMNGELDLALVLDGQRSPDLVEQYLYRETVYVCIPEVLLEQYYSPQEIELLKIRGARGVHVADIGRLPFAVMRNQLGGRIQGCFVKEGITPTVLFSGVSSAQTLPLCRDGVVACYCTQLPLLDESIRLAGSVNIFPLLDAGEPVRQEIHLLRHRDRHPTRFALQFITMLRHLAADLEAAEVAHVVG